MVYPVFHAFAVVPGHVVWFGGGCSFAMVFFCFCYDDDVIIELYVFECE